MKIIVTMITLALLACEHKAKDAPGQGAASGAAVQPESLSAQARKKVAAGAILLDVRTREEFAEGHVDGALNIPVQELEGRIAELTASKDVVVYCRTGRRSATAKGMLEKVGYTVLDIGPMSAW